MLGIEELRPALEQPNCAAFLRLIRAGESGQGDNAYSVMFGGDHFESFADHPRKLIIRNGLSSTAAGAYQFLSRTWDECAKALSLPDFSPASQDLAAVFLIARRGALADVLAGRVELAISRCAKEWASLPGSPYGQPTRTLAQALATYEQYGGTRDSAPAPPAAPPAAPDQPTPVAPEPATPTPPPTKKGFTVAPFLLAALPSLLELIPKLGSLFGGGSAVADRNIKAVEVVVQAAKSAIGAKNEQELVERIKADPAAAAMVKAAVEAKWLDIVEAGGGGIEGARKADATARSSGDMWQSPSWWALIVLVPLVYMIVGSLVGLIGTASWSDDVRAGLAGAITGTIIGGAAGYFWGQTTSRNRTPAEPSQ